MNPTLRKLLLCTALLAGAAPASTIAYAQGGAAGESPLARSLHGPAKDAYVAAGALMGRGDFAGAEAKYQQAYDLTKDPRLLFNMAACAKSRHAYARMGALLRRFKQESGSSISADDRAAVDEALAALPRFVGTVTVNVNVEGATVTVDGEPAGTAPLGSPLTLDPGRHTVVVTKDGYENSERPIDVSAGTPSALSVTLVVNVAAPPGAAAAGASAGAGGAAGQVGGGEAAATPESSASGGGRKWGPLVYGGFGLAGVGLIAGTVTGVLAIGKASSVGDQCDGAHCPTSVDSDLSAGRTMATVSTVSFIAAGVGTAAGVVGLLIAPKRESAAAPAAASGVSVTPWVGLDSAGVRGSF